MLRYGCNGLKENMPLCGNWRPRVVRAGAKREEAAVKEIETNPKVATAAGLLVLVALVD